MEKVFVPHGQTKELVVGSKVFKSSNDFQLTKKDLERARDELGETEEKKKVCLKELKEMLSKNGSVKYCTDDLYLLRFLRVRKYNVQKAYQNVKQFYDVKRKDPGCFAIPSDAKSVQSLNFNTYLPYCDEEGTITFWVNFGNWNLDLHSYEEMMQCAMGVCDIVTMNSKSQINGVIGVWDASGISMRQFTEMLRYSRFKSVITTILQNGYPYRLRKIIVLNSGKIMQTLYAISRPFLNRKVKEKVFLLGSDLAELHQHLNPAILPKTLGGALEDKECDITQHFINNLPYIQYERSFK